MSAGCVILGAASSLFVRQVAMNWRMAGLKPTIITFHPYPDTHLEDGTPVLRVSESSRILGHWRTRAVAGAIEKKVVTYLRGYTTKKTGVSVPEGAPYPSAVKAILSAPDLARACNELRPRFVLAQEAFSYGLAMALCKNTRKCLFPWGGDVFNYAESSAVAFAIASYALKQADIVLPSSTTAAAQIAKRFGISQKKIHAVSWGVDTTLFHPAGEEEKAKLRKQHGIPPDALVYFNLRRFLPLWGSEEILASFIAMAQHNPASHFIIVGGPTSEPYIKEARNTLAANGLSRQFTIFDGEIPLVQMAELARLSDIGYSLMKNSDMRSASILQAAASGLALVLSDTNPEFSALRSAGFSASFVDLNDPKQRIDAGLELALAPKLRRQQQTQNLAYIAQHENYARQMARFRDLCQGTPEKQTLIEL